MARRIYSGTENGHRWNEVSTRTTAPHSIIDRSSVASRDPSRPVLFGVTTTFPNPRIRLGKFRGRRSHFSSEQI